ncbi:MAG: 30S ribosomal protein S27ae [Candidatus Woesearchaeota archaeon]|jgi:small subunit ribosomal protein S27Ae
MAKAQQAAKKDKIMSVSKLFTADGKRARKTCPKCGSGYFLAEHKDRVTCGNCQYMEKKR